MEYEELDRLIEPYKTSSPNFYAYLCSGDHLARCLEEISTSQPGFVETFVATWLSYQRLAWYKGWLKGENARDEL